MGKRGRPSLKAALQKQKSKPKHQPTPTQPHASTSKAASAKSKGKGKAAPAPEPLPIRGRILLIGEGNFAFARSLAEHHMDDLDRARLVATTLDSLEITTRKYPDAAENAARVVELGGTIMHGLDATALESCKALKGMSFDSVVFNYPHLGSGETDQDRNVRLHQVLLLRFFRSVAPFLAASSIDAPRPRKRQRRDEPASDDELDVDGGEDAPGSVFVTLRQAKPYDLWALPSLARRGPEMAPALLPHPLCRLPPSTQPRLQVVRSQVFDASLYPGYSHRRAIGFDPARSTEDSLDTKYSAKDRRRPEDQRGESTPSRTWQLQLATAVQATGKRSFSTLD